MIETIRNLFIYDGWAVTRILELLKSQTSLNQKALLLLTHLLVSERIWLLRLKGEETSKINKSPEMSLAECENLASEIKREFTIFLDSLNAEDLNFLITYRNFKGVEFRTSVLDVLMHITLHGTYHRGQIAIVVRGTGAAPIDTDFITFVRETDV